MSKNTNGRGQTRRAVVQGAIAGGLAQVHVGYVGLFAPIAALLILLPIGRDEIRAAAKF